MSSKKRFVNLVAIFAVLGIAINFLSAQHASAWLEGTVTATLEWDSKQLWIDVSPGGNCTALFSGYFNYSCGYLMIVYFEVKLEGEDTYDWLVAISPIRLTALAGTEKVPVKVHLHVPPRAKENAVGKITVLVDVIPLGRLEPEFTLKDELTARIQPYYKLAMSCAEPYSELAPGKEHYFNIQINNLGNANDIFTLEITNQADFEAQGWFIDKSASSIYLPSGGSGNILIRAVAPREWTLWQDDVLEIDLKAKSLTSLQTQEVSDSFFVYLRQRGTYIPGFDPVLIIICLGAVAVILKKVKKK